jgi:hypothetical protein
MPPARPKQPEVGDDACIGLTGRARDELDLTLKVVKKPPDQIGFKMLPRKWKLTLAAVADARIWPVASTAPLTR